MLRLLPPLQPGLPIQPGSVSSELVHTDDLFGTLLRVAGVANPGSYLQQTDGTDIAPILSGQASNRGDGLYFHYPHYHHSRPSGAIRRGPWKLIEFFDSGDAELYDIAHDPGEARDLAALEPERTAALRAELESEEAET